MTATKEKALEMIQYMPDESMGLIISMLEALSEYTGTVAEDKKSRLEAFFSAAGNINIDSNAVLKLREESIV